MPVQQKKWNIPLSHINLCSIQSVLEICILNVANSSLFGIPNKS